MGKPVRILHLAEGPPGWPVSESPVLVTMVAPYTLLAGRGDHERSNVYPRTLSVMTDHKMWYARSLTRRLSLALKTYIEI